MKVLGTKILLNSAEVKKWKSKEKGSSDYRNKIRFLAEDLSQEHGGEDVGIWDPDTNFLLAIVTWEN